MKFSPARLVLFFENSITIVPESVKNGIDNTEDYEDFITVDNVTNEKNKEKIK